MDSFAAHTAFYMPKLPSSPCVAAVQRTMEGGADLRPPLKWAGGKRWLVPYLRPLWAKARARRLVEPLCGGLAVAIGLQPERALLNDINPHAINFYRWLKRGLEVTLRMENDSTLYYRHRDRFNDLVRADGATTAEAAQLFYYLNRTCYNGLCRFNRSGEFNVPFGRYATITYAEDFDAYRVAFRGWEFSVGDFATVPLRPDDFVYADPPYDVPFTQYSKEGFTWEDQERLVDWLSRHQGPTVVSNQATGRIVDLYWGAGYDVRYLEAPRMISCTGDRSTAREVLGVRGMP